MVSQVFTTAIRKKKEKPNRQEKLEGVWKLFNVGSTWFKLVKRLAYLLRLIDFLRKGKTGSGLFGQTWFSINYNIKDKLSVLELERSRYVWIYLTQQYHYTKEISLLVQGKPVLKPSSLYNLDPFMKEALLFVGGRLKNSLLSFDERHPLILPAFSRVTSLIVKECHARTLHGGVQLTLSTLRRQYWIIGGRQKVKSIIKDCHPCIRFRATEYYQKMGNLPKERIRPCKPFSQVGVDYAGPIRVRTAPGRGIKAYKGYICLFVCLSTKAVHLEIVSDLTAQAFIAAYVRFVSRRGPCRLIWSDQGTNFVGAARELNEMFQEHAEYFKEIKTCLNSRGTEWRFNPPAAPHFGGIWEAAVKSTKYHIRRVIGENTLTYEELTTLLCQIEACLNSRPLTPLSDDPTDVQPLTPAHILIQEASYLVPEPDYTEMKIPISCRWQIVQQMAQGFWKRWSQEYLQTLQKRNKWQTTQRSFQIDDLVLIKDENIPPAKWALGRIIALHQDSEGLVRSVSLRTATSTLDRPIVKLVLLPTTGSIEEEDVCGNK